MEREGGILQSTIPLHKRPESRIKISAISIIRSGPADSPPFQLSKISKISVFLHKQAYHLLRSLSFLSSIRFQTGSDFPSFHTFPAARSILPSSPSSALSLHHTPPPRKGCYFSLSYSPDRNILPLSHHPTKHFPLRNMLSIEQMPPNLNLPCAVQPAFFPPQSPQRYTYTNPTKKKPSEPRISRLNHPLCIRGARFHSSVTTRPLQNGHLQQTIHL